MAATEFTPNSTSGASETISHGKLNILVTGGAGYIGSVVTDQLIKAGHKVIVLDNLSRGHREAVHPNATFVQGDVGDRPLVQEILKTQKPDVIMHFAAFIEAGGSMEKPEDYFGNNTGKTIGLLEDMLSSGIKTFIFSSTAAVYGNPEKTPITEDAPMRPTNAYGASKALVEQILPWYAQIHGLRYAALRYFNVAGATEQLGEDHQPKETHLIPLAMKAAMEDGPFKLFGTDYSTPDGTCVRDYIHVEDLAQAHLLAMGALTEGQREGPLIYNLGNGQGFSNREVLDTVGRVVGKPVTYVEAPRRDGDPESLTASSEKIRRELDWEPTHTTLDDIIGSAYRWRRGHPNGYTELK